MLSGQPAAQAGIQAKDVVVAIDGTPVNAPRELQRIVGTMPIGKTIQVAVLRGGQPQDFRVTIGRFPEEGPEPGGPAPAPR